MFVAVENDALVSLPGGDAVGAAASRVLGKPGLRHVAVLLMLHYLGIDDRSAGDSQRRNEGRERRRQVKAYGLRVDDLDLFQYRKRVGWPCLQLHQPVEAELDGCSVDRRAVIELVAAGELEGPDETGIVGSPAFGELRSDFRRGSLVGDEPLIGCVDERVAAVADLYARIGGRRIFRARQHQHVLRSDRAGKRRRCQQQGNANRFPLGTVHLVVLPRTAACDALPASTAALE